MTINTLRRGRGAGHVPEPLAIGEADAEIFNCPHCARPLAVGTRRCPGCRTRLVGGVPAGRAALFVAVGLLAGILVGGGSMVALVGLWRPVVLPVTAGVGPLPSAGPTTTPTAAPTVAPTAAVPLVAPAALAALQQAATIDGRLGAARPALEAAVAAQSTDAASIARTLRSVGADVAYGSDVPARLALWSAAGSFSVEVGAFYADVQAAAHDGLTYSLTDAPAYRAAAVRMLDVLARVDRLDVAARALAAAGGVTLPPVAAG